MRRRQQQQQAQQSGDQGDISSVLETGIKSVSVPSNSSSCPRKIMRKSANNPMGVETSYEVESGSDDYKPFSLLPRNYNQRWRFAYGCLVLIGAIVYLKGKNTL